VDSSISERVTSPASRDAFSAPAGSVDLSRCAEQNQASIDCITHIESARLNKDVMEHHNEKGISMKHVQIKPHNQFKTALQPASKKQIPTA
jgi:hypothetical protein